MPVSPALRRRLELAAVPVALLLTAAVGLAQPGFPRGPNFPQPGGGNPGGGGENFWQCSKCSHKFTTPNVTKCPNCRTVFTYVDNGDGTRTTTSAGSRREIAGYGKLAIWAVVIGVGVVGFLIRLGVKVAASGASSKPSRKKKRTKPRRPPPEYFDDDEDDAPPPRRSARARVADDEDDRPAPKRARAVPDDGDAGFEVVDAPPPQLARRATRPASAPIPPRPSVASDSPFEVVDDNAPRRARPRPRRD